MSTHNICSCLESRKIHRDYYMSIFISYPISIRDNHVSPQDDAGQGLILGMKCKLPYKKSIYHTVFSLTNVTCFYHTQGDNTECNNCPFHAGKLSNLTTLTFVYKKDNTR